MAQISQSSHVRSYFYAGGEYLPTPTGHILQNQMYVEKLSPHNGPRQPYPIVFIHGSFQSGTVSTSSPSYIYHAHICQNWLNKPDGGNGWATWFLEHGYEVYIIDQPHIGRSPWYPQGQLEFFQYPAESIQQRFTASAKYGLWPQASLHTQWPGVSFSSTIK